jgi:hypothetical protein
MKTIRPKAVTSLRYKADPGFVPQRFLCAMAFIAVGSDFL